MDSVRANELTDQQLRTTLNRLRTSVNGAHVVACLADQRLLSAKDINERETGYLRSDSTSAWRAVALTREFIAELEAELGGGRPLPNIRR